MLYRFAKWYTRLERTLIGQLFTAVAEAAWRWHDVTPILDVAFDENRRKRAFTPKWK